MIFRTLDNHIPLNATHKNLVCILITLVSIGGVFSLPPIPQDPSYHDFADQRTVLGLQNFWDVISNIPFILIGLWGIKYRTETGGFRKTLLSVMLLGLICTGLGSGWYHYWRTTESLVCDRLPMTIVFMTFFTFIIHQRINTFFAKRIFIPLLLVGIVSVFYWQFTESTGHGDLRPYALVQFFPILMIPVILLLFNGKENYGKLLLTILALYVIAKVCEHFDKEIFGTGLLSGHTLKHFFAAAATWYILVTFRKKS